MLRKVVLFAALGFLYLEVMAEEWHCGADNMPFTADFLKLLAHDCPWKVRVELNNACRRHDSCYHRAKPANGGSEKARWSCDREFCSSVIQMAPVLWNACGQALLVHCGGAITLGWIAQVDWDHLFGY